MSQRGGGVIGAWAESQRQEQRRQEAQRRAYEQQLRDQERQQRGAERAMARMHREQQAAYRQRRDADARRRTEEIEARAEALAGLLAAGCRAPAFRAASMMREERVEPFQPGHLGVPIQAPTESNYQPASGGWGLGPSAQARQEARARFERDWYAARDAEAQRVRQLEAYRQQYEQWADATLTQIRQHNAQLRVLGDTLRRGEADAAVQFFSAALYASAAWPDAFPRQVEAAYDRNTRQLVLDWQLPAFDIVPAAKAVRYTASSDQDKEIARPVTARRTLYRDVLAQCVLLVLREVFGADEFGALESVAVNGFVDDRDPATGRRARIVLASVEAARADFSGLHLAEVSAVDCLVDALGGKLAARPDQRASVPAARRPDEVGGGAVVAHVDADDSGDAPNLFEMDPIAFEGLVAELFRARGLQAVTTQRSGDGGVDVEAMDPDPLSGGKIVVQVKRYRHTVPPTAVRDLYGTVHDVGANKGVLVTTSTFGPSSYTFSRGKPLTLINGSELVDLLAQCGLRGRLDGPAARAGRADSARPSAAAAPAGTLPAAGFAVPGTAAAPSGSAAATAPSTTSSATPSTVPSLVPAADPPADANVLGMAWSGSVALDICVLVCEGNRVLGDDYFVFYNNAATPDGAVRSVPASGTDKAAVQVRFDSLPARADRVVLVAAIDPSVNPTADLAAFTEAAIRLRDSSGTELDRLTVSDGRAGETALVLGSFRRRSGGDWNFVIGGRGYPGGLEPLLGDFGIDVA